MKHHHLLASAQASAVIGPSLHSDAALFQCSAATIRRLGSVLDGVRQRMFDDIARKTRMVACPIAERAPKSVHRHAGADALDEVKQCAVANAAILIIAGEDVELHAGRCSRIATARLDNGTV
jgi:hypothetical protein